MNSYRRIADKITVALSRIRIIIFTVGIDYSLRDNLKQCLNMSKKMYIPNHSDSLFTGKTETRHHTLSLP